MPKFSKASWSLICSQLLSGWKHTSQGVGKREWCPLRSPAWASLFFVPRGSGYTCVLEGPTNPYVLSCWHNAGGGFIAARGLSVPTDQIARAVLIPPSSGSTLESRSPRAQRGLKLRNHIRWCLCWNADSRPAKGGATPQLLPRLGRPSVPRSSNNQVRQKRGLGCKISWFINIDNLILKNVKCTLNANKGKLNKHRWGLSSTQEIPECNFYSLFSLASSLLSVNSMLKSPLLLWPQLPTTFVKTSVFQWFLMSLTVKTNILSIRPNTYVTFFSMSLWLNFPLYSTALFLILPLPIL